MKKVILILAVLVTISSCSFVKQIQNHCTVSTPSYNLQNGDFTSCLKCDSLAKVVLEAIKKGK